MSFFTEAELGSLYIAKMSLHLIGSSEEFEPRPELVIAHADFLLDILRSIAASSVYQFNETSGTKAKIEAICRGDISFEVGAQDLARDFGRLHTGASVSNGAFFVFELGQSGVSSKRFFALIKYDYYKALELQDGSDGAILREIVEALVSDKNAIQKAAIIRTTDGMAESQISTRDRVGRPSPNLTEYFQHYLEVHRDRSDDELTKLAKNTVRDSLSDIRGSIPGPFASAVSRGYQVLRAAEAITEDVIVQAAWVGAGQPGGDEPRAKLNKAVERHLKKNKLVGIQFRADTNVLRPSLKRKIMTDEGVSIEYDTALDNESVVQECQLDGTTTFIIKTKGFRDDVSAEKLGRSPRRAG